MKSKREEEFYELAGREVAEQRFVPGIWSKAFAKSLGDERAALALYITLRVEQLEHEFQDEQAKIKKELDAKQQKKIDKQQKEIDRSIEKNLHLMIVMLVVGAIVFLIVFLIKNIF